MLIPVFAVAMAIGFAFRFAYGQVRKAKQVVSSLREEVAVVLDQKQNSLATGFQDRADRLDKRSSALALRTTDVELRLAAAESEIQRLGSLTQSLGALLERLASAVEGVSQRLDREAVFGEFEALFDVVGSRVESTASVREEVQGETPLTADSAAKDQKKDADGIGRRELAGSPYWNVAGPTAGQLSELPISDEVDLPEGTEEVDEFMRKHVEYRLQKGFEIIRSKREG